jgi:hypothetical protein
MFQFSNGNFFEDLIFSELITIFFETVLSLEWNIGLGKQKGKAAKYNYVDICFLFLGMQYSSRKYSRRRSSEKI